MLAYRGELPENIALDTKIEGLNKGIRYPFQYGYSLVGQVIAIGDSSNESLMGKKVFAFHPHESHFVKPIHDLIILPSGLDSECGVFLPNMETALGLIMDGAPMVGENVLVLGLGVVGQLLTLLLQRYPLNKLTLVDPLLKRRALVLENPFTEVLPDIDASRSNRGNYDLRVRNKWATGSTKYCYSSYRVQRKSNRRLMVWKAKRKYRSWFTFPSF